MSAYSSSLLPSSALSTLISELPEGSLVSTNHDDQDLQYNYIPTEYICIIFLCVFSVTTCSVPLLHWTDRS